LAADFAGDEILMGDVYKALHNQEKLPYDAHNHPEETPAPKVGHFRLDVPEAMFQQPEANFRTWLEFQIDNLRHDIITARKRWQ
jgi:hypothetical protein